MSNISNIIEYKMSIQMINYTLKLQYTQRRRFPDVFVAVGYQSVKMADLLSVSGVEVYN